MPATSVGSGFGVLEDPTGRRAVWLRRAGRVIFILFLAWLLAIVLGGLGLVPVAGIPLTHVLGTTKGPPPLARLPKPRQPSASDLRPAVSAKSFAAGQIAAPSVRPHNVVTHPKKHHVHVKTSIAPVRKHLVPAIVTSPGRSASAPGHTKTTAPTITTPHGRSATAPGQTKTTTTSSVTTTHGRSTTAPGKTKTTATATTALHGRSATARGRTKTTSSTTTTTTVTTIPQHGRSAK